MMSMNEIQLAKEIRQLEKQMLDAAKNLEFEQAAEYRDEIKKLKNKLFVGFVEPESEVSQPSQSNPRIKEELRDSFKLSGLYNQVKTDSISIEYRG